MKKTIMLLGFICLVKATTISAQTDISKDIRLLFKVNGTETVYKEAIVNMLDMMGESAQVTEEIKQEFKKEFTTDDSIEEMMVILTDIYKKHFTQAEIKEMIKFYESPVGKKMAEKQSPIMMESMEAGQAWGQKIGMKIAQKMEKKKD
jgi:hypothetical protein